MNEDLNLPQWAVVKTEWSNACNVRTNVAQNGCYFHFPPSSAMVPRALHRSSSTASAVSTGANLREETRGLDSGPQGPRLRGDPNPAAARQSTSQSKNTFPTGRSLAALPVLQAHSTIGVWGRGTLGGTALTSQYATSQSPAPLTYLPRAASLRSCHRHSNHAL